MSVLYTAFYFREEPSLPKIDNLHCTHKFLGDYHGKESTRKISRLIDLYFKWAAPAAPGYWVFNHVDLFDDDAIVLRRPDGYQSTMLPDLRKELDPFRKDDHPYAPHVTIAKVNHELKAPIPTPLSLYPVAYCLVAGRKKIGAWSFGENKT